LPPLARANIAILLREGGRGADALPQALRALREAPDSPSVANAYIGLLLGNRNRIPLAMPERVAEDTYVRLTGPHDESRAFLIDRAGPLWSIDAHPPEHPFASLLIGKSVGEAITIAKQGLGPDEVWTVAAIKNKYLHVLHVLHAEFEQRFIGYKGGIVRGHLEHGNTAPILEHIRQHAEANQAAARFYTEQALPLELVARMLGGDVISFAGYVRELGSAIHTCVGTPDERLAAISRSRKNAGKGVVLDSYTAFVAAELNLLPALKAFFGEILLAHSTIDLFNELIVKARGNAGADYMTIVWQDGQFFREMITDADTRRQVGALERVKAILLDHATPVSVVLPDREALPADARDLIDSPFYLPIFLAAERGLPLLCDDGPTRVLAAELAKVEGLWLQPALTAAGVAGHLTGSAYATALAGLAARRHTTVSVQAVNLVQVFRTDPDGRLAPFRALASALGGPQADMRSHINVATQTIQALLHPLSRKSYAAVGIVLEELIKGRPDYAAILAYASVALRENRRFDIYLHGWIRGHFLPIAEIRQKVLDLT
jgi:hypothetical protein